jgi:predicted nucleic-acid-binding protein
MKIKSEFKNDWASVWGELEPNGYLFPVRATILKVAQSFEGFYENSTMLATYPFKEVYNRILNDEGLNTQQRELVEKALTKYWKYSKLFLDTVVNKE